MPGLGIHRFDAALGGLGGCFHRYGIDVGKPAQLRDQVAIAVGHQLGSALAAIPAVPAALR
ncbi:hypothetical protein ACGFMK_48175 [Amycolatopsis sp. NPDC049252]|uniref:hypothetical protein n=1 Tax=Amycolatopsis sp. NPDC049252 TaxID=3363933 RepID=UPI0037171D84